MCEFIFAIAWQPPLNASLIMAISVNVCCNKTLVRIIKMLVFIIAIDILSHLIAIIKTSH